MDLHSLKTEIQQLETQSRACRARINASTGRARSDAWDDKRRIGNATRNRLLAYAFLRGRPYAQMEPPGSCPPVARLVAELLGVERGAVAAWLAVPHEPAALARRAAAQAAWQARRGAIRATWEARRATAAAAE